MRYACKDSMGRWGVMREINETFRTNSEYKINFPSQDSGDNILSLNNKNATRKSS